jgi:hypothetical protein
MVWPLVIARRLDRTTPRLLQDFVRLRVIMVALGAIISEVFEASISGFLAASGVAGLVLGFALRSMIADFFFVKPGRCGRGAGEGGRPNRTRESGDDPSLLHPVAHRCGTGG